MEFRKGACGGSSKMADLRALCQNLPVHSSSYKYTTPDLLCFFSLETVSKGKLTKWPQAAFPSVLPRLRPGSWEENCGLRSSNCGGGLCEHLDDLLLILIILTKMTITLELSFWESLVRTWEGIRWPPPPPSSSSPTITRSRSRPHWTVGQG